MDIEAIVKKYPRLNFLKSPEFRSLSKEKQDYIFGLIEDNEFWIDLEKKPNSNDGFKFIAAAYGLQNAEKDADEKGLEGKEREKILRPHQDLFTVFNPYSGNGRETQQAASPEDDKKIPEKK